MPELVLIMGPNGVGKTTFAANVYSTYLQPEQEGICRALMHHGRTESPEDVLHREMDLDRLLRVLRWQIASACLIAGHNVCLTIRGETRTERMAWIELGRMHQVPVIGVLLTAPPEVCISRCLGDVTRSRTQRGVWQSMVSRWFRRYEPIVADEGFASWKELRNAPG